MRGHIKDLAISLLAILFLIPGLPGTSHGMVLDSKKFVDKVEVERTGGRVDGGKFGTIKGFPSWKSGYNSSNRPSGDIHPKIVVPVVADKLPAEKGTMVIWFYYEGAPDNTERRWERVAALVDNNARETWYLSLIPAPFEGDAKTVVHVGSGPKDVSGTYATAVAFDQKIPARRWSYLAVTWGPDPAKDNRIYLNGVPARGYYSDYGLGGTAATPSVNMRPLIASAKTLYLGGDPGGDIGFYRGSLGELEIHDEIMTVFNFPLRGMPNIKSITDDTFKVPGISGKLVAGDRIRVSMEADPAETASFDFGPVKGVSMSEDPAKPGAYSAVFEVPPGIFAEKERIVGHLSDNTGLLSAPVLSPNVFTVDSRSRFAMTIDKTDLPADSSAVARVKVTVKDANDKPIKDHQIKVTLSTTDEYTGLVGGGSTRSRDIAAASKDALAGADVETRWKGATDSWGEVEFDFKSGFAAKTIILQAKDLTSGDVGVDYITSYKEASIDIALTPPISRAAARRGITYILKVEATRTELTADGRSRSVIRATLTDPNGTPVVGDPVVFALSSANGSLRTIQGMTDASGIATAEYTAGKKIGIVVVTATATLRNATGNVSIILLADAPAKVYLKARPASLPADGTSRADLSVKVTDINDNPNRDTTVEFKVAKGGGKIEYPDRVTDKFGDTANRYTAGNIPGIATILATVRSKVPTEGELTKARNVIFVPYSPISEEIKVSRWLKRVGETALKGEPLVEYTIGGNPELLTLNATYDCRIDFQYVEYWDTAQTGDTLAQISPVVVPGSANPLPAPVNLAPRRR